MSINIILHMTENETKEIKIITNGQYIKDFSFENLQAPQIFTEKNFNPEIKVSIDLNAVNLQKDFYESSMSINATAIFKEKKVFILELVYGGIFNIDNDPPEDELKEILFVYCPTLLFPFARRIIADVTKDASLPPLLLDPMNFRGLYDSKKHEITKQ